jgi:hypothetical protein
MTSSAAATLHKGGSTQGMQHKSNFHKREKRKHYRIDDNYLTKQFEKLLTLQVLTKAKIMSNITPNKLCTYYLQKYKPNEINECTNKE